VSAEQVPRVTASMAGTGEPPEPRLRDVRRGCRSSGLRRNPTIVDVAREAGVSVSTVSRVLRGKGEVHDDTRQRIELVINDFGYRPSYVARALVSGASHTLGLLVSDIANPFYPQLAKSIEAEARARGYAVVICNTGDEPAESVRYVERLLDQGVDGFIHASAGPDEEGVLRAIGDPRRIVFTNRRPASTEVSFVVSDNRGGAVELTRHLLARGHRRIGFISGPSWASNSGERLAGFLEMVNAAGAAGMVIHGDFQADSGRNAVRAWLAKGELPTAIVAVNDTIALSALAALAEAGAAVPQRVAVAGFDNIGLASSTIIGLTTVAQQTDEMGRRSVRLLLDQLAGRRRPPARTKLKSKLFMRATTAEIRTETGRP
jgi:LacI family transcriptional regulator